MPCRRTLLPKLNCAIVGYVLSRFVKKKVNLDEKVVLEFALQIVEALEYWHSEHNYIHGFLHPEGVVVGADDKTLTIVTICDLHTTVEYIKDYLYTSIMYIKDAYRYAHPDLLRIVSTQRPRDANTQKLAITSSYAWDFWSVGCLVLYLWSRGNLAHADKNGITLDKNMPPKLFVEEMIKGATPVMRDVLPKSICRLCKLCFAPKWPVTATTLRFVLDDMICEISDQPKSTIAALVKGQGAFQWSKNSEMTFAYTSKLGGGTYGAVYRIEVSRMQGDTAKELHPESVLALKVLHAAGSAKWLSQVKIDRLLALENKNVVKFRAFGHVLCPPDGFVKGLDEAPLGILMEFCEGRRHNTAPFCLYFNVLSSNFLLHTQAYVMCHSCDRVLGSFEPEQTTTQSIKRKSEDILKSDFSERVLTLTGQKMTKKSHFLDRYRRPCM